MSNKKSAETPLDTNMDCRACGSANHGKYDKIRSEEIDGQVITWKRTDCTECGQSRTNRFGRPAGK